MTSPLKNKLSTEYKMKIKTMKLSLKETVHRSEDLTRLLFFVVIKGKYDKMDIEILKLNKNTATWLDLNEVNNQDELRTLNIFY